MYKEKIINVETGEETWRDYTVEEIAEVEKNIAFAEEIVRLNELKRQERLAVLVKLGITEEEAAILLS